MADEKQNQDLQYRQWKPDQHDANGNLIPMPRLVEAEAKRDVRIAQEQAEIKQGFNSQPVAGHRRGRGRSRREDG